MAGKDLGLDRSLRAKWGQELAEISSWRREGYGGFIPLLRSFLRLYREAGLSPGEAIFVLHVLDSKWDENLPKVKSKIIAKRMGLSVPQIKRYIRRLERLGVSATYDFSQRVYVFDLSELFARIAELAVSKRTKSK